MTTNGRVVINLATGLEDPERVTVAFLVAGAAAQAGRQVMMFLTKEAVRLALPNVVQGVACDGLSTAARARRAVRGRGRADARVSGLFQRAQAQRARADRWCGARRRNSAVAVDRRGGDRLQLLTHSRVSSPQRATGRRRGTEPDIDEGGIDDCYHRSQGCTHSQPRLRVAVMVLAATLATALAADAQGRRKPDLVERQLGNPPAQLSPGVSFKVADVSGNRGAASAGASLTRYYLVSGATVLPAGARRVPALKRHHRSRGRVRLSIPVSAPAGRYSLLACVDANRRVAESNERNNCRAARRRVVVPGPGRRRSAAVAPTPGDLCRQRRGRLPRQRRLRASTTRRFILARPMCPTPDSLTPTATGSTAIRPTRCSSPRPATTRIRARCPGLCGRSGRP